MTAWQPSAGREGRGGLRREGVGPKRSGVLFDWRRLRGDRD